jgi:hypothetical protein
MRIGGSAGMNEARRDRVRELIQMLESLQGRVQVLWEEEDKAFEGRPLSSKETGSGKISEDAAHFLSEAREDIQNAIDQMNLAIGDDSLPLPTPAPIHRRA